MDLIRFFKRKEPKKALVFGMGGGGDIVATVPTASLLHEFGFEVMHGSVVWDRYIVDPKPGPRAIEELENCEVVNATIALATPETGVDGIKLTVSKAAKYFGRVVCLDITKGAKKLAEGLKDFMGDEISVLVAVDSGGDVLAQGFESGLKSPLADSISLAAISEIEDSVVGVFGFGSDGELRIEELLDRIAFQLREGGFLGCTSMGVEEFEFMRDLANEITTEASSIPLDAFKGELGLRKIRFGRTVPVSPLSVITFYFKASKLYQNNVLARNVIEAGNIEEARKKLNSLGIFTEMDYEYLLERKEIGWL
jgi:hypothetical protein